MTQETMLQLLKIRVGITSTVKDQYLQHVLDSTIMMLADEKGINADLSNPVITSFVIDYATWKYESKGEMGGMPRHIQYALHNLMIHNQKSTEVI